MEKRPSLRLKQEHYETWLATYVAWKRTQDAPAPATA